MSSSSLLLLHNPSTPAASHGARRSGSQAQVRADQETVPLRRGARAGVARVHAGLTLYCLLLTAPSPRVTLVALPLLCPVQDKRSFYEQFQDLKGSTDLSLLDGKYPKPSLAANAKAPTAHKVPLSDVVACRVQRPLLAAQPKTLTPQQVDAQQNYNFFWRMVGFVLVHGIFFSVSI